MNLKMGMVILLLSINYAIFGMQQMQMPKAQVLSERLEKAGVAKLPKMTKIIELLADQNKNPQDILSIVADALDECDNVAKKSLLEDRILNALFHDNKDLLVASIDERNKAVYEFMKGSF